MRLFQILPFIFYFINTYPQTVPEEESYFAAADSLAIYLVKQSWHTGIVFSLKDINKDYWPEAAELGNSKYIDVGWGDAEFYRHPGFDAELAVKALFFPTATTLRIERFNFDIEKYINHSDYAVRILLTQSQLDSLSKYISEYYLREDGKTVVLDERYGGNIIFYKARENYHLFRTCNTWIAEGLKHAGLDINTSGIVLASDLFEAAGKISVTLPTEEK